MTTPGDYDTITIDGSVLEGGGQILRIALSLSGILRRPIRVVNIRGNRPKPGLMAQHLIGARLVADITGGQLSGGEIGSREIVLKPGKTVGEKGNYFGDTKTAGSTILLLQATLPILAYRSQSPTTLRLRGGTNAAMAPQVDFTTLVLQPLLARFGITFDLKVVRRGYYPRGGGELLATIQPIKNTESESLPPIVLDDFGELARIDGYSFVGGKLPVKMANVMADSATNVLKNGGIRGIPFDIRSVKEKAVGNDGSGSGIVLIATSTTGCKLSGSALGSRDLSSEQVGAKAGEELLQELQNRAAVDQYTQDQLIIFMALASGRSSILTGPITMHTKTAIYVTEQMMPKVKFEIQPVEGKPNLNLIQCEHIQ